MEDEGSGHADADEVQRFTEELTGRSATTVGDEDGEFGSGWLYAAVIAVALAANYAVFRYFGASYLDWYVSNGAKLALALGLFSLAIKLDDEPGLIAAHPTNYLSAWFAFFGQGFFWLSNILKPESYKAGSLPVWDDLVTILFALAWTGAAFLWLGVVVPAQYCATLVCGAPVRLTLGTRGDVIVERFQSKKPRRGTRWLPTRARRINVGRNVREQPVTATAAISAAVLFALSLAV